MSSNCFFTASQSLVNGSAQQLVSGTAAVSMVGTCTFNAAYGGDANNDPSQSGNLDILVTGTTTQEIIGQTSNTSHGTTVSITLQ